MLSERYQVLMSLIYVQQHRHERLGSSIPLRPLRENLSKHLESSCPIAGFGPEILDAQFVGTVTLHRKTRTC